MKQKFIEDNLIIISKQTSDLFLKQENPADVLSLYWLYYYTAKWQETNQPKCSTGYVAKGLNWSMEKVKRTKKVLIELGLIEDIRQTNQQGKITGWYIKINYIWKKETLHNELKEKPLNEKTTRRKNHPMDNPPPNALSANNLNASSVNKETIPKGIGETPPTLSSEVQLVYPKRGNNDVNELTDLLKDKFNLKVLDGTIAENRRYCWLAIKKFKRAGVELIINVGSQDEFWQNQITGFKNLYYKGVQIASAIKKKGRKVGTTF